MYTKCIYISVFVLFLTSNIWGQLNESKIKAGLIYKFISTIDWPDQAINDTLNIGIFGTDTAMVDELKQFCVTSALKGVINEVDWLNGNKLHTNQQVVFFDDGYDKQLLSVSSMFGEKPVLIITYNSDEPILTMINMQKQKRDKTISYTINKEKIEDAGLVYKPELLLHGGDVSDIKELYIETSLKLNERAQELDSLGRQVEKMLNQREYYKQEVSKAQLSIDSIKTSVANKEQEVTSLNQLILAKDANLDYLGKELQFQLIQKNKLANELSRQLDSIKQAELDLSYLNKELGSLNNLIQKNQLTLNNQKLKIESQKKVLFFVAISGVGLFITVLSIAFALRAKRLLANRLKFLVDKKTYDLNLSRQYYKGLFDNSPVAICEFDFTGLIGFIKQHAGKNQMQIDLMSDDLVLEAVTKIEVKDINKQAAKLFAVKSKVEFIQNYINLFTEESVTGLRNVYKHLHSGTLSFEFEMVRKSKTNSIIHLIESLVVLPESEGDFSKVIVSMLDITDLKMYEKELVKHRDHLEDLVKERANEIIQLNDDLFNANEELHSKNDDLSNKNKQLRKQQEEISELNENLVFANNQLEEQKEELIRTIDQLNETQKQLVESEKMASLGMLTAGVAHEINNPVNFISGGNQALELMLGELWHGINKELTEENSQISLMRFAKDNNVDDLKNNIKEITDIINVGVHRINEIVKSLQNYAQRDTDRYSEVKVEEEINSALGMLKNKYENKVAVTIDCSGVGTIISSSVKLNQVIVNVLSNAFDAISTNGVMAIKGKGFDENYIELSFSDNGKGMTDEELSRIFDPFYTTKEPGEGTGLGMYLSYGIVEQLKGKISVVSEKGAGTTVKIVLPKNVNSEL